MIDAEVDKEDVRKMIAEDPSAWDGPECPTCGRPMVGSKTPDGPFCVWECGDS